MALTILDGSNPTLDASQLSYEFEKASDMENGRIISVSCF